MMKRERFSLLIMSAATAEYTPPWLCKKVILSWFGYALQRLMSADACVSRMAKMTMGELIQFFCFR